MTDIKPLPHIEVTKPYVPGGKLKNAAGPVAMLASNENPFGPSPKAVEAMQAAATATHIYPDPTYQALRETIAREMGIVDVERVVVSAGSDEIIHLLTQAYAGPEDEVLFTEYAFSMYRVSALSHGATPVTVPETDLTADMNALLGAVSPRTKVLFLANPNNPTGTMMPVETLASLQAALPPHVLFVIDGAYAEYVGPDYEEAIRDMVDARDNTVMIRTFSKIHGLASARLGWAYMPAEIAQIFQRIRPPFNVNAMAEAAGRASVADREFLTKSRDHNTADRGRMIAALRGMGLETPDSFANFVLPDFGDEARANAANEALKAASILVRAVAGYGLPTRLRISVGSVEDNSAALDVLKAFTASR